MMTGCVHTLGYGMGVCVLTQVQLCVFVLTSMVTGIVTFKACLASTQLQDELFFHSS